MNEEELATFLTRCHDSHLARYKRAGFEVSESDVDFYVKVTLDALTRRTPCPICGREPSLEHPPIPTHVVSHVFGGKDDKDNLLPLCTTCNREAATEDWYRMSAWLRGHRRGKKVARPVLVLEESRKPNREE